ncbi:hypothetical protein B0T16DRAFT_442379 [Cercophora newfieldiana]|uniref:Uncharacterized protein n=1 Tax=Cercophora newfieldiana TaxID=92897 RepID=A0AA39YSD7_9PEZI|nr:hypothetical protein B0T16DRAFT_442379 [Cercophora newfieldiana]
MATLNGMEASLRAVLQTAKNSGMSFRRAIKVVNGVFDSDKDNDVFSDKRAKGKNIDISYSDDEDDEEEAGDEEEVEAITTPGTGSSKRKALNFPPASSTPPKKPKRKAVAETPTKTKPKRRAVAETPTKTKLKSTASAAGKKPAQKGPRTQA